jgi:hypothetical protein
MQREVWTTSEQDKYRRLARQLTPWWLRWLAVLP